MAPKRKNLETEKPDEHGAEAKEHKDEESSSDDGVGPALPAQAPVKKKRKVIPFESLYLDAMPRGTKYSRSLMHKDQLAFTTFTPRFDFLLTASIDGQVNFWKKRGGGQHVEFVKDFQAHTGELTAVACSMDGRNYATCGKDRTVKVWDVVNFDIFNIINVTKTPISLCWVNDLRSPYPMLAVGNEEDGEIAVFNGEVSDTDPLFTVKYVHKSPVTSMAYHRGHNCVVSTDEVGMIEYWEPTAEAKMPDKLFRLKPMDLYELVKNKQRPTALTLSPTGERFATFSFPDRKVRIFTFATGKYFRVYDESIPTITHMHQAGTAAVKLEDAEFGKRLAVEKELENTIAKRRINVIFDESGNFVLYGSLVGVKLLNIVTNRVRKVYGAQEPFRCLNLALYQGRPDQKDIVTAQMAASDNPLLREAEARDPTLVATGPGRVRFYMFTNDEDVDKSTRDIHNEKPRVLNKPNAEPEAKKMQTGSGAILYTTKGDIHIRLCPREAPKAVENFVTLARNGYYNDVIFHRVIPKFMIQTGDPDGNGTGGQSIWGKEFEDEFSALKHDEAYTVSMANHGPNTNGSQFFITTKRTPWLDGLHTIFGHAVDGLDVIRSIEKVRCNRKTERPIEDISIRSIRVID